MVINSICIISILLLWWSLINVIRNMKRRTDMAQYKMNMEAVVDIENISKLLEDIINESFIDYTVLELSLIDLSYINSEYERKIVDDVLDLISKKLSPVIYDKLSLYYNKKIIPEIISEKVFMVVTSYVIEYNRPD